MTPELAIFPKKNFKHQTEEAPKSLREGQTVYVLI
jgi:hypothetical protein